ncbi:MAG: hypothetical protein AAF570_26080, partial [Bacteroidota bacterium]
HNGVTSSGTFQNAPSDLQEVQCDPDVPPGATTMATLNTITVRVPGFNIATNLIGPPFSSLKYFGAPFVPYKTYVMPTHRFHNACYGTMQMFYDVTNGPPAMYVQDIESHTAIMRGGTDGTHFEVANGFEPFHYVHDGANTVPVGRSPVKFGGFIQAFVQSGGSLVQLANYINKGPFVSFFNGAEVEDFDYTLYDGSGGVLLSGSHTNSFATGINIFSTTVPYQGPMTLEAEFTGYDVQGTPGLARAVMTVNTAAFTQLQTSHRFNAFSIRSNGLPTEVLTEGEDNEIVFGIREAFNSNAGVQSVTLEYKLHGGGTWLPATIDYDPVDDLYYWKVPCSLTAGLYDVRVAAIGFLGKSMTYTLEPAFQYQTSNASNFNWKWAESINTADNVIAEATAMDLAGNVYTVGRFNGAMQFNG